MLFLLLMLEILVNYLVQRCKLRRARSFTGHLRLEGVTSSCKESLVASSIDATRTGAERLNTASDNESPCCYAWSCSA